MKLPECLGALLLAGTLQAGCSGAPSAEKVSSTAPGPNAETAASTEKAPLAEQTGGFDGQRAYEQVAKLVSFGPRPPDTEALHHSQEYIIGQLRGYGCEVEQDYF